MFVLSSAASAFLKPAFRSAAPALWIGKMVARAVIVRTAIAAGLLLAVSAVVQADEAIQEWIPDALDFPEDMEVITDREIGSTIRLFSISTAADLDALFVDWEEGLRANGFQIEQQSGELLERSIEFSGPGISNAKIIVSPTDAGERSVIQFDVTLN